jgi:Ulp1 family protease
MADEKEIKEVQPQKEEVKESPTEASKTNQEKTLTQSEVNKLLADERRKHDAKYNELKTEYTGFKQTIEQREQAANDAAAEKVEALRKDLPEPITKLLDRMTPVEQLEWLNDPTNNVVTAKKEIPALPSSREGGGPQRKTINIV